MAKPRHVNHGRGKSSTHVVSSGFRPATPGRYIVDGPAPDTRTTTPKTNAKREPVQCPLCDAMVRPVRSTFNNPEAGITLGSYIYPNHRPDGGLYSARRGDIRCMASGEAESA